VRVSVSTFDKTQAAAHGAPRPVHMNTIKSEVVEDHINIFVGEYLG